MRSTYEVKRGNLPPLHPAQSLRILLFRSVTVTVTAITRRLVAANQQRRGCIVVRGALGPDRPRLLSGLLGGRREEASYGALWFGRSACSNGRYATIMTYARLVGVVKRRKQERLLCISTLLPPSAFI